MLTGSFGSVVGSPSFEATAESAFLHREPWGLVDDEPVERITFGDVESTAGHGLQVSVITYGAIVQSVRHRRPASSDPKEFTELTLGYDDVLAYEKDRFFMGATVGRYANRIRDGRFVLPGDSNHASDVIDVSLSKNDGSHCLHGGPEGFSKKLWRVKKVVTPDNMEGGHVGVTLSLRSRSGDQGFPGTLDVEAEFMVHVRHGALRIRYRAVLVDGPATAVSLSNHCYWNLSGRVEEPPSELPESASASPVIPRTEGRYAVPSIDSHCVKLKSDFFLTTLRGEPVPDGGIAKLHGGPLVAFGLLGQGECTFNSVNTLLEAELSSAASSSTASPTAPNNGALPRGAGIDHCFVVRGVAGTLRPAARVWDPKSGRQACVWTTYPGMQVYSGNFLAPGTACRGHSAFGPRSGFCIEPQQFPDAPNHAHFPTAILRCGETYHHEILWSFE